MADSSYMKLALRLARRGLGSTSPNPMVGAVLVKRGEVIGRGWHRRAGAPHAEMEAIHDAAKKGHSTKGATLYVTLEPCCTQGRTPPCTEAIQAAGIRHVVVGTMDPNPKHEGRAFRILRRAGIRVTTGLLRNSCGTLNEPFNHWIISGTPFVTVKAAMTLDGKIATKSGESKWITADKSRAYAMKLRQASDAILVGVNTVLADDPSLTARTQSDPVAAKVMSGRDGRAQNVDRLRRIVLDSMARTPLTAKVVTDGYKSLTTIVVSRRAPELRVASLGRHVNVILAPEQKAKTVNRQSTIDLRWLLRRLGSENVTSLLVEGGGEVNASFLLGGLAQRVAFFYAPKILGGSSSRRGVAGEGVERVGDVLQLDEVRWRKLGMDLLLTARVTGRAG